jgi:endonuclease YncB( thermonuclease family)
MGFRFRKSSKVGPLRLTLTHKGLSGSLGAGGLSYQLFGPGKKRGRSRASAAPREASNAIQSLARLVRNFLVLLALAFFSVVAIAVIGTVYTANPLPEDSPLTGFTDTAQASSSSKGELTDTKLTDRTEPKVNPLTSKSSSPLLGAKRVWISKTRNHFAVGTLVEYRAGVAYLKIDNRFQAVPAIRLCQDDQDVLARLPTVNKFTGKVVDVTDGDTITVLDDEQRQRKVRLEGIDAPEITQSFGENSKEALAFAVLDRKVTVEWDKKGKDGRTLGHVFLNDTWVNRQLLRHGWAWHLTEHGDSELFSSDEQHARTLKKGLWAEPAPTSPWGYREKLAAERERVRLEKAREKARLAEAERERLERQRRERASYISTPSSSSSSSSGGRVHVRGYYRKDGTYVRSHTRSR